MARERYQLPPEVEALLQQTVNEKVEKVKEVSIDHPMAFFIGLCRGVHDVVKCEECVVYQRKCGHCGFLVMACRDDEVAPTVEA